MEATELGLGGGGTTEVIDNRWIESAEDEASL